MPNQAGQPLPNIPQAVVRELVFIYGDLNKVKSESDKHMINSFYVLFDSL